MRYLTNQWDALQRYVDDGRLAIDINRAENQLRVVAVGRENWLFAGSFDGATRAALLYSLVQSCTLIGVSPFTYLKDVLLRVVRAGQDRRVQETHRYKAESHTIIRAATELFRAGAQLPEEKTRSPRRDDLATVKLRAISEVRRDST